MSGLISSVEGTLWRAATRATSKGQLLQGHVRVERNGEPAVAGYHVMFNRLRQQGSTFSDFAPESEVDVFGPILNRFGKPLTVEPEPESSPPKIGETSMTAVYREDMNGKLVEVDFDTLTALGPNPRAVRGPLRYENGEVCAHLEVYRKHGEHYRARVRLDQGLAETIKPEDLWGQIRGRHPLVPARSNLTGRTVTLTSADYDASTVYVDSFGKVLPAESPALTPEERYRKAHPRTAEALDEMVAATRRRDVGLTATKYLEQRGASWENAPSVSRVLGEGPLLVDTLSPREWALVKAALSGFRGFERDAIFDRQTSSRSALREHLRDPYTERGRRMASFEVLRALHPGGLKQVHAKYSAASQAHHLTFLDFLKMSEDGKWAGLLDFQFDEAFRLVREDAPAVPEEANEYPGERLRSIMEALKAQQDAIRSVEEAHRERNMSPLRGTATFSVTEDDGTHPENSSIMQNELTEEPTMANDYLPDMSPSRTENALARLGVAGEVAVSAGAYAVAAEMLTEYLERFTRLPWYARFLGKVRPTWMTSPITVGVVIYIGSEGVLSVLHNFEGEAASKARALAVRLSAGAAMQLGMTAGKSAGQVLLDLFDQGFDAFRAKGLGWRTADDGTITVDFVSARPQQERSL